uniref:Uncharacterized protein n=1 Tax=Setaria italica TaxID=4555 RepID=K3ZL26_SETIT
MPRFPPVRGSSAPSLKVAGVTRGCLWWLATLLRACPPWPAALLRPRLPAVADSARLPAGAGGACPPRHRTCATKVASSPVYVRRLAWSSPARRQHPAPSSNQATLRPDTSQSMVSLVVCMAAAA